MKKIAHYGVEILSDRGYNTYCVKLYPFAGYLIVY